ncbi:MAG: glutamate-5-semialdehyde dehydrogenase [Firmicutes bacterium]|nr:glutamate-5-semialdehyde dehydrogenase [Bacillota bacterium]
MDERDTARAGGTAPAALEADDRRYVRELALQARAASRKLATLTRADKDRALEAMARALAAEADQILAANAEDVARARERGMSQALLDRLTLNPERVRQMSEGLLAVAALPDPIGETVSMSRRPNGLEIGRVRVPLGVVGMIYEARPNVTADAAGLCLKTGNAVLLRGSSDALNSNRAIASVLAAAARDAGIPDGALQLVDRPGHGAAGAMMEAVGLIDVLIPRGGRGLIERVVAEARVPVIETGVGNCHVFVDDSADLDEALAIVINAKTSRPSVCNAMETLLVHRNVAEAFLPRAAAALRERGVELRGCPEARRIVPDMAVATEQDWHEEYLDLILAVRVVPDLDAALEHIAAYGTRHSEAIVTRDYVRARRFLQEVDAAVVYVNASTRFTDGFEFGLGAEIGISTQKLHARGPMGLEALTSVKNVVYGSGQIRV